MTITASMVKELRERTGVGMMECKKALVEAQGDMEAAITAMRKSGQAKAAKRAGRIAAEGMVLVTASSDNKKAYMIEVNSETDFVARDKSFRDFASHLVQRGLETESESVQSLLNLSYSVENAKCMEEVRTELVTQVGENIQLRRVACLESKVGAVGFYCHGDRIGVLVAIDKADPQLAKEIALHIAAMNPQAIDAERVPDKIVEKEKDIVLAQAKKSGKPDSIIEKMVAGRIKKFLKEICLVDQAFIKDPDQTVGQLLQTADTHVLDFVRFEVGEGIEKEIVDFSEEVHAQIKESK